MKKLFLILFLLSSILTFAQISEIKTCRIANASTTFNQNIPIGTQVYNVATGELWISTAAVLNTATLTTASSSFKLLNVTEYHSKSISVESPTSSEDISMFYTDVAITIIKMTAVQVGTTPSLTWTIRHSTDRSATGNEVVTSGTTTTSTTTGDVITSFNDATIAANSFVWLETTAQSGTVDVFNVTIKFTDD